MNTTSRTVTGVIAIILGLVLLAVPFFVGGAAFATWIYGIPILIIGLFILFNKKEDDIEQIKERKDVRRSKR